MSDRSNHRIHELLAQARTLWVICERFDEISFELRALAPLTRHPAESKTCQTTKTRLSTDVQQLRRRRAAILNHLALSLARHRILPNATMQTHLLNLCQNLLQTPQSYLGLDPNTSLTQLTHDFDCLLAAQQLSTMRHLAMRLELALIASPGYQPRHTHRLLPGELNRQSDFLCALMAYDAYPHDYPGVSATEFCHFIAYHYAHVTLHHAEVIDLRSLVPEGEISGIAGSAFIFGGAQGDQVFVNFRGAERSGQEGEWLETTRDWRYLLSTILLGQGDTSDQLPFARTFITRLRAQLTPGAVLYGLGHSLGGQLVQAVQLLDCPFKQATVVNAVPMQIAQLERAEPGRFTPDQWQILHRRCAAKTSAANLNADLVAFGETDSHITHLSFADDFTTLFTWAQGTATIGQHQTFTLRNWPYPFTGELHRFLNQDELNILSQLVRLALNRLQGANSAGQMASQLMSFATSLTITLFRQLNQQPVVQFLNHIMGFLYASGLFTTPPQALTVDPGTRHASWRRILSNLNRERDFFRSLNRPMLDTMITMHIVSGAKFLITDAPTHWPVVQLKQPTKS